MDTNNLQTRVKKVFQHFEISAEALGRKTGKAPNTYRNMMKGNTKEIALSTVVSILDEFTRINARWLLTGKGEMLNRYSDSNTVSEPSANYASCPDCMKKEGELSQLRLMYEACLKRNEKLQMEIGMIKQQLSDCLGNLSQKRQQTG